jgi:sugar phosphate isomerase/epimerase
MPLKVGIDSYCFHRFFGEVYPEQETPPFQMKLEDFIEFCRELDVDGVSVESCFIPQRHDAGYMQGIGAMLDDYGFDRVYAWGHPDGLERGQNADEYDQMIKAFESAQNMGAKVMRVVGSSLMFVHEPHQPQIDALVEQFSRAVKIAADFDIKMAIENHIDFTSDEILQLLERVDSPYLGLNFDTGNFLRLLDDPIKGMEKLAKHTLATHCKDLRVQRGVAPDEWYFFSATPVGDGYVDNLRLAQMLKDADYQGFLAMEIDFLHPDYNNDEHDAVRKSVAELRRISAAVG